MVIISSREFRDHQKKYFDLVDQNEQVIYGKVYFRDLLKGQEGIKGALTSGNKSVIRKIEQIFLELSNNPYEGTGNPEALKYHLSGYWSRRIDKKNRIVYKVYEDKIVVLVVSAIGHYKDK